MSSSPSKGSPLFLAIHFLLTAVLLYFVFGFASIYFTVAVTHAYDLSPTAENQIEMVGWWLWTIPAVWSVALLLAILELLRQNRAKRLLIYTLLPILAAVLSVAVAWAAVWLITLSA